MDIYKIDVGDIIFVNLKNSPNSSGYYTVKVNGMIDFPLAGEKLVVAGRTADQVAQMLAAPADDQAFARLIAEPMNRDTGVGAVGAKGDVILEKDRLAFVAEGVFVAELAEILMQFTGYGWDPGHSPGEGLSNLLGALLHPAMLSHRTFPLLCTRSAMIRLMTENMPSGERSIA